MRIFLCRCFCSEKWDGWDGECEWKLRKCAMCDAMRAPQMNNKINKGKHGRKGTWHLANGSINDAIEEKWQLQLMLHRLDVARCTLHVPRHQLPVASSQFQLQCRPPQGGPNLNSVIPAAVAPPDGSQQPLPPAHSQLRCNPLFFRSACNPAIDRSIAIYRLCAYQFGQHLRANKTSQGKSQRADCPIVTKRKKKKKKKVAEGKVVSPTKREDKRKEKGKIGANQISHIDSWLE